MKARSPDRPVDVAIVMSLTIGEVSEDPDGEKVSARRTCRSRGRERVLVAVQRGARHPCARRRTLLGRDGRGLGDPRGPNEKARRDRVDVVLRFAEDDARAFPWGQLRG